MRGYNKVYLKEKLNRPAVEEEIAVPIESIYITANQATRMKLKVFDNKSYFQDFLIKLCEEDKLLTNQLRKNENVGSAFEDCIFLMTSTVSQPTSRDQGSSSQRVARFIHSNGGTIIDEGFERLLRVSTTTGIIAPDAAGGWH